MSEKLDNIMNEIHEAEACDDTKKIEALWSEYHRVKYEEDMKPCPNCSEKIYTGGIGFSGAYKCDNCGTYINKNSQTLLPPSEWEELDY